MPTPSPRRGVPHKALKIATYQRLDAYLKAFAQGHFDLLVLAGTAYESTEARVQAFVAQGGGCRATFFNHSRKLAGVTEQKLPDASDQK